MVSSVLAEAILSQRAPDIVGSFKAGRAEARQEQVRTLTGEALRARGGAALEQLRDLDPKIALELGSALRASSAADIEDFVRDASVGKRLLQSGNTQGFVQFAQQRSNTLRQQGRDTSQTDRVLDLVRTGNSQQALDELTAFTGALGAAQDISRKAFAPITIVDDETGEERLVTPTFDPRTGEASLSEAEIPEGFRIKSKRKGAEEAKQVKLAEEQAKQSTKIAGEQFNKIAGVRKSILNIDQAISAIDKGAKTGAVERFLPTIRESSIELENIAGQMGLDIVGATTFGALSESELAFALSVALPTGLDETELRAWLVRKREAQDKLRSELQSSAVFLSRGGTIAELIEREGQSQQQAPAAPQATQAAPAAAQQPQRSIQVDF